MWEVISADFSATVQKRATKKKFSTEDAADMLTMRKLSYNAASDHVVAVVSVGSLTSSNILLR